MPFNGSSGSGDVTGEVVYANYGRLEDFNELGRQHIDLHGKIVITRYGANFRGVKVYIAEQRGAIGVLIYSDPQDDGYYKGDAWPMGPWRPDTGVQRGSVQYLFKYPGDPETPGVASTPDLPDSARIVPGNGNQPHIISIPISYHDAAPILQALKGPGVPQGWQGALPFRYHLGPGGVKVHLVSEQDYQRRIIWDVIGKIKGSDYPDEWVVAGNHRDAWVYGAVDPTAAPPPCLRRSTASARCFTQGWRPKRTIVFCSWDAEEEGLIGSTEWVEQHWPNLNHAVAYFNVDVAVAGPDFGAVGRAFAQAVRARDHASVPSPMGGTVYQQWRPQPPRRRTSTAPPTRPCSEKMSTWATSARAPTSRRSCSMPAFLHRHWFRRPLRRLSLDLRRLRLVRPERRPAFRLSAGDGARLRARGPAHGRYRRAALRLRHLCPRRFQHLHRVGKEKARTTALTRSILPRPRRLQPGSPPPRSTPTICKWQLRRPGCAEHTLRSVGDGPAYRRWPAQSPLVQAHHLRARRVHRLRGGRYSGRE